MTTGWGADPDPAPRIAYELTAAVADGNDEAVSLLWSRLDPLSRAHVVAALGAQARNTAWSIGGPADTHPELLAASVIDVIAELVRCHGRMAALHALSGQPDLVLPDCDGCPLPAVALARARLRILQAIGFPPAHIAEISRRAARR